MALPYLDNPATLDEATVQELDGLVAKLNTFLGQQHNQQGGHTNITATSIVVDGPVTVRDAALNPSTFRRTVAFGTTIDIQSKTTDKTPYLTIRYRDALNQPMLALVHLGIVGKGSTTGPGIALIPDVETTGSFGRHRWDLITTTVSAGPALILLDATNGERAVVVVDTLGHYELRPESLLQDVWLGTNGTAEKRFRRGYIDDVHSVNTFERGRTVSAGDWQDVPFNVGDFYASPGSTWDVDAADVFVRRFTLIGQTMHYNVTITSTNVTTAPANELLLALPAGYLVGTRFNLPCFNSNAGSALAVGFVYGNAGENVLRVRPTVAGGVPWTLTLANNTNIYATLAFEVTG